MEAVRLGAVTYVVPFMLLLYPGMTAQGDWMAIGNALLSGLVLVIAIPAVLSGQKLFAIRALDIAVFATSIALAIWPHPAAPLIAGLLLALSWHFGKARRPLSGAAG